MKLLVVGIVDVNYSLLLAHPSLINLHRLMEVGCFGRLYGDPTGEKLSAWLSLFSGREMYSEGMGSGNSEKQAGIESIVGYALWDAIAQRGDKSMQIWDMFLVQMDLVDSKDSVYAAGQEQFKRVHNYLASDDWHYLQFIDTGITQLQLLVRSGLAEAEALDEYLSYLDDQIGLVFEALNDETLVLVVSPVGCSNTDESCAWFILASSNNPLSGEILGVNILEIAPTVIELGGYEIPGWMEGKSLAAGKAMDLLASGDLSADEEAILRERLSGLGYIS